MVLLKAFFLIALDSGRIGHALTHGSGIGSRSQSGYFPCISGATKGKNGINDFRRIVCSDPKLNVSVSDTNRYDGLLPSGAQRGSVWCLRRPNGVNGRAASKTPLQRARVARRAGFWHCCNGPAVQP